MLSEASQAQSQTLSDFLTPTKYCYTGGDLAKIASYSKSCEKDKLDLKTYHDQYETCQKSTDSQLIGSEVLFWGSVGAALLMGFLIGSKAR